MPYHAALVVEPVLEVPQAGVPEVEGLLAQEGCQAGLKQDLHVAVATLTKHLHSSGPSSWDRQPGGS